jgi:DNA primase
VGFNLDPAAFTIFTVPERVEQHGDPMTGMLAQKPDVASVIEALGKLL